MLERDISSTDVLNVINNPTTISLNPGGTIQYIGDANEKRLTVVVEKGDSTFPARVLTLWELSQEKK